MNTRIKAHLQYSWWCYLLIAIIVVTLWVSVFSQLAKPKAYEVLNITIVGTFDGDSFEKDIANALEGKTAHPLKKINVEVISGKYLALAETIAMRCISDTDIILFDEEFLFNDMSKNFRPINDNKLSDYFGEVTYYTEDNEILGLLLYDGDTDINFKKYYKGENKFWAFITPVSQNAAGINGIGEAENNSALQAIKYLMGVA